MAAKKPTRKDATVKKIGAKAKADVQDAGLKQVSNLAVSIHELKLQIAELEDVLAAKNKMLKQFSEVDLPEAMREVGIESFTTPEGLLVSTKEEVTASIAAANRLAAFSWLIDHGFGGMIKTNVGVQFGSEQLDDAVKLDKELRKEGYEPAVVQSVHPQTLKAFVKEQLADANNELPMELFGVYPYTVATVKMKK